MIYFLDTQVCIYHLKNSSPSFSKALEQTPFKHVKIPAMVAAELIYGAVRSPVRDHELKVVKSFLSLYEIAPFDERAAEVYAVIRSDLEKDGQIVGRNDLITAAIVLAHDGTLVTRKMLEFSRISGLKTADWTTPR